MDVEVKKIPCGPEGVDACTPGSANGQVSIQTSAPGAFTEAF